jgi:hypothetical protein
MNATILLAQIWGPIILAVGLGYFVSRTYYIRLYKNIQNEPLATLTFGVFAMVVGILHIFTHNIWNSFTAGFVSFLGWGTFLKGATFLVAPKFVDKAADWEVAKKLVPAAGILLLIFGVYLTWVGYFS